MRVVHLGLGNFHRAHQAVYTQLAGPGWTVTAAAHRSRRVVKALRRQGMRYTVLTLDGPRVTAEPVSVITEALVAGDEPALVVRRIADPATAVVTLTITEAGYCLHPGRRELDVERPDVAADVAARLQWASAPQTAVGLLCRGLAARAAAGSGPISVVSCDNLAANGETTRAVVSDFAAAAGLDELAGFATSQVDFPSTMVDRIVPATTARHVELARAAGYDDDVPVPAEPFRQWVLQPHFPAGRPAWERSGAVFVDDVAPWETVKVRLLNGVHSLLAYLGLLRGPALIAEAYADPVVRAAADALHEEYRPTLQVPPQLDLEDYRARLGRRFANAALGHRSEQVGSDGSLKLRQRVPAAACWHLERDRVPAALALLVAAFIRCSAHPEAMVRVSTPLADPAGPRLRALGAAHRDPHRLAQAVLVDEALLGPELAEGAAFTDRVGDLLQTLQRHGVDAAVKSAT